MFSTQKVLLLTLGHEARAVRGWDRHLVGTLENSKFLQDAIRFRFDGPSPREWNNSRRINSILFINSCKHIDQSSCTDIRQLHSSRSSEEMEIIDRGISYLFPAMLNHLQYLCWRGKHCRMLYLNHHWTSSSALMGIKAVLCLHLGETLFHY